MLKWIAKNYLLLRLVVLRTIQVVLFGVSIDDECRYNRERREIISRYSSR